MVGYSAPLFERVIRLLSGPESPGTDHPALLWRLIRSRSRPAVVGKVKCLPHDVATNEGVGLVDPTDAHRRGACKGELHRHGAADREVVGLGRRGP
jgi:hypothetical protein